MHREILWNGKGRDHVQACTTCVPNLGEIEVVVVFF